MSGLSTKDVVTGGGLPKTIQPGEHILKINAVRTQSFPFMEKDNGLFLIIDVETKPIEGFEGFFINKDDESLGRYLGQIGQIKTNRFYYKDGQTKSGIAVNRDMEILKQVKNLCLATDSMAWFDEADSKYATIEEFVEAFTKDAPFKNAYLKFCVAGKEFARENNYMGYDLYFPKLTRGQVAYEPEDVKLSKLIKYVEAEHLTKYEAKAVESFGEDTATDTASELPVGNNDEFAGAPEFEL